MAFKKADFTRANFVARTAAVPVPDMLEWFEVSPDQRAALEKLTGIERQQYITDEIGAVWTVRGLTSSELATANDNARGNRQKLVQVLAEALAGGVDGKKELAEHLTLDPDINIQTSLQCEHVVKGSVDPPVDMPTAVKLSRAFPIEFQAIANKIAELTGLGMVDEKKSKPSGDKSK